MKYFYTVALAGNPNVGKSTIFNSLTGMHQHTGNWTGKTVANAKGEVIINDKKISFVDLPGIYSIMSNSEEEEIARDYLCFNNPDVTVIVVDSTILERNLNLVFQILELTDNIILCVNLLDEAKKKGIKIDLKKLGEILGVPVVGTSARNKKTLQDLNETIYKVCNKDIIPKATIIKYDDKVEECIKKIETILDEQYGKNIKNKKILRWISLKLIDGEERIINSIEKNLGIDLRNKAIQETIYKVWKQLEEKSLNKDNFKDIIISQIVKKSEDIAKQVCIFEKEKYNEKDRKIDKIITSKTFGIPIMILFLGLVFWITIVGANYPSEVLLKGFQWIQNRIFDFANYIKCPTWLSSMLIYGIYQTLTWIIAVMLPPMAIFFPLFTILEDLGYLPRIAFNMDGLFKKAGCSGKQMITMCMGFGCNSCGVTGCRIISSPREKLIAILTNNMVPCNGRFPILITISSIFIAGCLSKENTFVASILSTLVVIIIILIGIYLTLIVSKLLSETLLKGIPSSMILELPPYRKPEFGKIFIRSIFDRTLFVLGRAISVAAPAGLIIWLLANISINGSNLLFFIANFFDPFAKIMGLDGYILTAFIIGMPANEIVLPIILMSYLNGKTLVNIEDFTSIGQIMINNGWSLLTALNVMIFTIFHFPCATTLLTIKKETNSWKWVGMSFIIPTVCGILICMGTTLIYSFFRLLI